MCRLTYRYWWIVLTLMLLAVAAAMYYTRRGNQTYKVNAVAFLNGPTIRQFEQAYEPLRFGKMLPDELPLKEMIKAHKVKAFETYRVIDCLGDSVADYVDFKRKSTPTDTVKVQMQDRICLQFRVKYRDLDLIPDVEHDVLAFLNANDAMQQTFEVYRRNLTDMVAFNHSQLVKLDSLTTHYYFHSHPGAEPVSTIASGLVFMGDWRVHLFLGEIYGHQAHSNWDDLKLQRATAPVVLENHFVVDPKPVNGRLKFLVLFVFLAWIGGCCLAGLLQNRKAICAWLKQ